MSPSPRRTLVFLAVVIVAGGATLIGFFDHAATLPAKAAPPHDAAKVQGDPPFGINVTSSPYNAACDGSADDSTAIQNALNAAPSTGARVQIPATSAGCRITSTLTVPQGVILEGESPSGSELWFDSSDDGPAVRIGSTTGTTPADQHGGGLQNIGIHGDSGSGAYPHQIGVQVSRAVNVDLDNVLVENTGVGYQVDAGPAGDWSGELTFLDPKASNVVTGLQFTDSGGYTTDTRVVGGYFYGVSTGSGVAIDAHDLHSSQFGEYSFEHFGYGLYASGSGGDNVFFGGRAESSGPKDGTAAFVCDGISQANVFYGPHDSDVAATTVTNLDSAACTRR